MGQVRKPEHPVNVATCLAPGPPSRCASGSQAFGSVVSRIEMPSRSEARPASPSQSDECPRAGSLSGEWKGKWRCSRRLVSRLVGCTTRHVYLLLLRFDDAWICTRGYGERRTNYNGNGNGNENGETEDFAGAVSLELGKMEISNGLHLHGCEESTLLCLISDLLWHLFSSSYTQGDGDGEEMKYESIIITLSSSLAFCLAGSLGSNHYALVRT